MMSFIRYFPSSVINADFRATLDAFDKTAVVICHKNEPTRALVDLLSFLPVTASAIVVTAVSPTAAATIREAIAAALPDYPDVFVLSQFDPVLGDLLVTRGVGLAVGEDGCIRTGKGEGMFLGTVVGAFLGSEYVVYVDADNNAPASLLEYVPGMVGILQRSQQSTRNSKELYLNVRLCWPSKPFGTDSYSEDLVRGRCTSVVSPLCGRLLRDWTGLGETELWCSNSGEQAFTMQTAKRLHFSSGYSIETFLLLQLLSVGSRGSDSNHDVVLTEYHARSNYFHTKRNAAHIDRLIAESLGAFRPFWETISDDTVREIESTASAIGIPLIVPRIYETPGTVVDVISVEAERIVNSLRVNRGVAEPSR